MARPTGRAIREELVVAAQTMAQERGVAEFSYRDLADVVGIRVADDQEIRPASGKRPAVGFRGWFVAGR